MWLVTIPIVFNTIINYFIIQGIILAYLNSVYLQEIDDHLISMMRTNRRLRGAFHRIDELERADTEKLEELIRKMKASE